MGGEIRKNILQNLLSKPEDPKEKPNVENYKIKTHLVIYGIPHTAIACAAEIITLLKNKKIKFSVLQQGEVAYDLAKFPSTFKKWKTPEIFQDRLDDDRVEKGRKSSGDNENETNAVLNYEYPQEIKAGALAQIKAATQFLDMSEIGKSALNVICNKITGYSYFKF